MTSQSETPLKKKARFLGMSSFGSVTLYRSWRLAVRRIVSSGIGLHHQCAGGVFLCLESLETRQTRCLVTMCCSECDQCAMDAIHALHGPGC